MTNDIEYQKELEIAMARYEDLKERGENAIGRNWEEVEAKLFTPEEIRDSHLKAQMSEEQMRAKYRGTGTAATLPLANSMTVAFH